MQNYGEAEERILVPDLFCFLKSFICGKSKWSTAYFQYISMVLSLAYNKNLNKLNKNLDHWSRDRLSFHFWEKSLELVSPPHFAYDFLFFKKVFFSCYILLTGQISLPIFYYFSRYWDIYIYIYMLQLLDSQVVKS